MTGPKPTLREQLARLMASHFGPGYDAVHADKSEWKKTGGMKDGEYRDINENRKDDYDDCADAVLELIAALAQPDARTVEDETKARSVRDATIEFLAQRQPMSAPKPVESRVVEAARAPRRDGSGR